MAIYTVHVPSRGDLYGRADGTAFVRDGFSWSAFAYGPLYFLQARAWVAAVLWVVVVALVAAGCWTLRVPFWAEAALALLILLFTGLEGSSLRRLALHRRGYDLVDVVDGPRRSEAERVFFAKATLGGMPPRRTVQGPGRLPTEPVIGFFGDPALSP